MTQVFYIASAFAIVAAFLAVTRSNALHAVLYLVLALFALTAMLVLDVSRSRLGFVFGLNGFLEFLPMPPLPEPAGNFMGALAASGYFFPAS